MMISTRGNAPIASFSDVLLAGLAPDGGLYLPQFWPQISPEEIASFKDRTYSDVAHDIVMRFAAGSFSAAGLAGGRANRRGRARVGRRRRIVAAYFVEGTVSLVAAVDDVIEDSLVALRQVHRFDNVHIGRVFHHAVRVAWRQVDIGNEGVTAVCRIDLAVCSGEDLLVGADNSEGHSPERRRLDAQNLQPNDARISHRGRYNCSCGEREA